MNFLNLQNRVFTALEENSTTPVFWTATDVKESLNDGVTEMVDIAECFEVTVGIPSLADRLYYDLRTHLPRRMEPLAPRRIYSLANNEWLEWTSPREMDRHTYLMWETTRSAAQKCFMRGFNWLGVWGQSSSDGDIMRASLACTSPPMEADYDEPPFDREFHLGLVEYAVYDLKCQEQETRIAMKFWQRFIPHALALAQATSGRIARDRVFGLREARSTG